MAANGRCADADALPCWDQAQGLARLRERYQIRVEGRDDLSTPGVEPAAQP